MAVKGSDLTCAFFAPDLRSLQCCRTEGERAVKESGRAVTGRCLYLACLADLRGRGDLSQPLRRRVRHALAAVLQVERSLATRSRSQLSTAARIKRRRRWLQGAAAPCWCH